MRDRIFAAVSLLVLLAGAGFLVRKAVVETRTMGSRPFLDLVTSPIEDVARFRVRLGLEAPKRSGAAILPGDHLVFRVHVRRGIGPYEVGLRCTLGTGAEESVLISSDKTLPARPSPAFVAGLAMQVPASVTPGMYECMLRARDAEGQSDHAQRKLEVLSPSVYDARRKGKKQLVITAMNIRGDGDSRSLHQVSRNKRYAIGVTYRGGRETVKLRARLSDASGGSIDDRLVGEFPVRSGKGFALSKVRGDWSPPLGGTHPAGYYTLTLELSDAKDISAVSRRIWID